MQLCAGRAETASGDMEAMCGREQAASGDMEARAVVSRLPQATWRRVRS